MHREGDHEPRQGFIPITTQVSSNCSRGFAHVGLVTLAVLVTCALLYLLPPTQLSLSALIVSSHCQLSLSAIALLLCRVYQLSLVTQAIGVLRRLHVIVGRKSTWNQQVDLDGDGAILAPVHRASLCMRCVSALCLSVYGLRQCTVPLCVRAASVHCASLCMRSSVHHAFVCAASVPQCMVCLSALCLWMCCCSMPLNALRQCLSVWTVSVHCASVCAPQCTMPLYALRQCTAPQLRYLSSHTPLTRCK